MTTHQLLSLKGLRFLVAGYGLPAEIGIATLLGNACQPDQIRLLTHELDERNAGLLSAVKLRGINHCVGNPKSDAVCEWVEEFEPDVILSLHYRFLIPQRILAAAKLCSVNLHPSLLPKYRGTNSVAWAIINGETTTGFSYHHMGEKFDTGAILLQEELEISPEDTAFSLFHRQIIRAMTRLESVLTLAIEGVPGMPQVGEPTYYERKLPYDGLIDKSWIIEKVDRFIRAMYFPPFPPAMVELNGKLLPVRDIEHYHEIISADLTSHK